MGRHPLSIEVAPKDRKVLASILAGGVQQVRVVLRALSHQQLAKGISAPQIASVIPLTPQAIRNIGHRYQKDGLDAALYEKQPREPQPCLTKARRSGSSPWCAPTRPKVGLAGQCV